MMKLKSYNCRGLRKAELADIIVKCDVLLLQETWLAKQELELLNDLHEDYSGFGTAKCDYANGIITGRKSGGTPASTLTIRQPKPNRWFNVGPTATYLVGPTLLCSLDKRWPNINCQPKPNQAPTITQHCPNYHQP